MGKIGKTHGGLTKIFVTLRDNCSSSSVCMSREEKSFLDFKLINVNVPCTLFPLRRIENSCLSNSRSSDQAFFPFCT